ncbi:class I SAM-dependent methyltransferase [Spirosoma pulveris]
MKTQVNLSQLSTLPERAKFGLNSLLRTGRQTRVILSDANNRLTHQLNSLLQPVFRSFRITWAFVSNLKTTGALYETSKKGNLEVSRYVTDENPQVIVEFGAGHGNITRLLLSKMNKNSRLYAFEINREFCQLLTEINDDRLVVINDSAQYLKRYCHHPIDCIVSSIPFSLISNPVIEEILCQSKDMLSENGIISQILYSTYHLKKYKKHFTLTACKSTVSLPVEFIYHCQK